MKVLLQFLPAPPGLRWLPGWCNSGHQRFCAWDRGVEQRPGVDANLLCRVGEFRRSVATGEAEICDLLYRGAPQIREHPLSDPTRHTGTGGLIRYEKALGVCVVPAGEQGVVESGKLSVQRRAEGTC